MNALKTISTDEKFPNPTCKQQGKKITYSYDSMNRRVARTDEKGTYQYLYGNPNHPFQVTAVRDHFGNLSVYHYDDFGLLFAIEYDANWYYVTTDQLGTPQVVCDADGEVIKVMQYDSFGHQIADSNPAFELHISFAGGLADGDTELFRFGFRDYDSASGKWTAKDQIGFLGGDGNLYGYVVNNPLSYTDPNGMKKNQVYFMYDKAHGGEHIDRYENGLNTGRFQLDGTPIKHMGKCPKPISGSQIDKFTTAATKKLQGIRFGYLPILGDTLHMGFELIDIYREANKAGRTFQEQWDFDQKEYERNNPNPQFLIMPLFPLPIPNPNYHPET